MRSRKLSLRSQRYQASELYVHKDRITDIRLGDSYMTDIQNIYSILLARGYQDELFSGLGDAKRQGQETLVDCPLCGKERHFSYNSRKPVWRCWSCGEAGDWIDFLQKTKGYDFMDALQELASAAGVELSPQSQKAYQSYTKKADILEAAQAYFMDTFYGDYKNSSQAVVDYILERGYSLDDMEGMELGAYTDRQALQDYLQKQGYAEQEMRESGLLTKGFGEDYQLTLLWRDAAGRATGIVGRAVMPAEELKAKGLPKYKYSYGMKKDEGMIGFSSVRGSEQLILLEGVLDALYLNYKGFQSVAVGGTSLSAAQLHMLEAVGTKEILLALDMDEPGQRATEKILRSLAKTSMRAYVISLPEGYKDADELVRKAGAEAFQDALDKAERGAVWMARRIVSRHDISTDRGMDKALEEALEAYTELEDVIKAKVFRDSLQKATELSDEELESRLEKAKQSAYTRKTQAVLSGYLRDIQEKTEAADITGAEDTLARALREVRVSRGIEPPEPYLLDDLTTDIISTTPAMTSGYQKLDDMARIPVGALTIIAGRPGHGKTTLQLNILTNMMRAYPEKKFYYFSYEEARKAIALKLIMIQAGETLHELTNFGAYINYMKDKRDSNKKIEAALAEYEELTLTGRLSVSDVMYRADDLATVIDTLASRGDTGAVIVDYIQRIPLGRKSDGQRYLDIKYISSLLLEQAVSHDIPIILGAQLTRDKTSSRPKLDNMRESGDIEQDANLVLGLYTKAVDDREQQEGSGTPARQPVVDMEVYILKNRAGQAGGKLTLSFNQPVYKITDKQAGGLF
jgi:DNA primase catalytic core